jgi:hypothetical protein
MHIEITTPMEMMIELGRPNRYSRLTRDAALITLGELIVEAVMQDD